jgi:hypothetical protein
MKRTAIAAALTLALAWTPLHAETIGVTATEIRIGGTFPFSGP